MDQSVLFLQEVDQQTHCPLFGYFRLSKNTPVIILLEKNSSCVQPQDGIDVQGCYQKPRDTVDRRFCMEIVSQDRYVQALLRSI